MRWRTGGIAVPVMLAVAITVSACAALLGRPQPPEVTLEALIFREFSIARQHFGLVLDVYNPNPYALTAAALDVRVEIDDHPFASGQRSEAFTVGARSHERLEVDVTTDIIGLLEHWPDWYQALEDGVSYRLEGSLQLKEPRDVTLPLQRSGHVRLDGTEARP